MNSRSAALRLHVESALAGRVPSPFRLRHLHDLQTVPAGIPQIDSLTGGLPRGGLTEIFGPPCSGRTSLLLSALASRTAAAEVCALVDARDAFDPHSAAAAGVKLDQLLWVRCANVEQAMRSTDLLIHGGGFGLVALDLSDIPPHLVRHVPLNVWFRLRRAVENTPTLLLLLGQESHAKTCASLVLRLEGEPARWSASSADDSPGAHTPLATLPPSCAQLLDGAGSRAEIIRSRMQTAVAGISPVAFFSAAADGPEAYFETEAAWKRFTSATNSSPDLLHAPAHKPKSKGGRAPR
jgi:recombination protein RecA